MRITTLNANGIRSAARKGFFEWMDKVRPDIVCIQETKAQLAQLREPCFFPPGYHAYYCDAEKKGYSGVAIYSRLRPDTVRYGLGDRQFDAEGRWLEVEIGRLTVASVYLPSGSSAEARQAYKFEVLDWLLPRMQQMCASGREFVVCGDLNIAHKEIDLKNWRSNQKNSGFLPEERAWMDRLFGECGWVDAFRAVEPGEHQYTWWSNRGRAWDNNTGWRIDYQVTTPGIGATVERASIYKDERFSDHAPLTMDYAWEEESCEA